MKTSDSISEISKALSNAWGAIENPKHNKTVRVQTKKGGQYTFEYTDLGGVLDAIKPHFKENGLAVTQSAGTELTNNQLFVVVKTRINHSSGEWMESNPLTVMANNSIQEMGGQITYLKRYSLSAMLGISTEEDDDANGSFGNQVTYQQNKSQQTQEIGKAVLLAKFKQGGGTGEQFDDWYAKQVASGYNHNQMDQYLTKALMKKSGKQ